MSKNIIIILAVVAAAVGVYFFMKKKDTKALADSVPPVNSDDENTFKAMLSEMKTGVANWSDNQPWILESVKDLVVNNGAGKSWNINEAYLVDGKVTKTGALLAVYAASVGSWGGGGNTENKPLTTKLYRLFDDFKSRNIIF